MNPLNISRLSDGYRLAAGCVLAVMILAVSSPARPASAEPDQQELSDRIIDLIRQEDRDQALPLCRTYTDRYPDDQVMLYNLACLENTTGHPEEAVAAFTRAVAAGFDDFSRAFSDPDLAGLTSHPDMVALEARHRAEISRLAAGKTVTLSWQEVSAPIALSRGRGESAQGDPEILLTWTPVGLDVELHAAGPWAALAAPGNMAPWNGGPGLVFTLGVPDSNSAADYLTVDHFLFAFGMEKGNPQGALYLAGQNRWQSVSELLPKIRLDGENRLELRATIPWTAILPYRPLVDDRLGFNAALHLTGSDGPRTVSVLPDPAAFRPGAAMRRVVPLAFRTSSIDGDIFAGRVSRTIGGVEPITFDLVAASRDTGDGVLTIDFLGGPDQSLLPAGQVTGTVPLRKGMNRLTRQADFSALDTGVYVIKASLEFPSGRTLTWGASVLHLADRWREGFQARIDKLDTREKPTALYYLDSIDRALADHPARRSPGRIASTLDELGRLLDNHDKGGSILPDRGSALVVFPIPGGGSGLCHLYLPSGWKIAAKLDPVLVLTPIGGASGAITARIGRNYEQGGRLPSLKAGPDGGFPVYLAPRAGPLAGLQPGAGSPDLVGEARACLAWARETFKSAQVSVAGVGPSAAVALRLAQTDPADLMAMIIFAGGGLEPWPQADADFIGSRLAGFPVDLPVTWADFVNETEYAGQGPLILDALKKQGCDIVEVQEVRGGLNFTQVADRTVLWAEGLR